MLIQGTPWHVTTGDKLQENKSRRHKYSCLYYDKDKNFCVFRNFKCVGSSHCDYFKLKEKNIFNKKTSKIKNTKLKNVKNHRYDIIILDNILDDYFATLIKAYLINIKLKNKNLSVNNVNKIKSLVGQVYKLKNVSPAEMNEFFYKAIRHYPEKLRIIFNVNKFIKYIIIEKEN